MENRVFCPLLKVNLCHDISNPRSVRSEYKMPVNRQVELVNRYNFRILNYELRSSIFREKLELRTRPSILCVTHRMSRKKRDYSVG